jgi:hypothetical protein
VTPARGHGSGKLVDDPLQGFDDLKLVGILVQTFGSEALAVELDQ